MASTMQLDFSQAMSDFKTMFPEMDKDVIEAVLRANQGAVDATIDQLLAMSTDNQNERLRHELEQTNSPTKNLINIDGDEKLIDTKSEELSKTKPLNVSSPSAIIAATTTTTSAIHNTGASPKVKQMSQNVLPSIIADQQQTQSIKKSKWNPPLLSPLPPGFLRITNIDARDYDLPDEQFAMMLQNEEFMNELRWNQEFMSALEKEQQGKPDDDAAFKERLKHMGKVSRKKFLQVARVFTWQRNKKTTSAKQIDSLPLKEEPSDDEEIHNKK